MNNIALNVSEMLRHFQVPYTLLSPIGTGIYGEFVRSKLKEKKIPLILPTPEMENGCCYCFVEDSGERAFACYHGAEL